MNPRKKPKKTHYDVIIIGAGIGGLTTGALLAKAGKKVLVIEAHDRVGGYAQSFRRKGFSFDSSIHAIGGCGNKLHMSDGDIIGSVFDILDISDQCNFIKLDPFYSVMLPGMPTLTVPTGVDNFIKAYSNAFPEERFQIEKFVKLCEKISSQAKALPPKIGLKNLPKTSWNSRTLLRYSLSTLQGVMDKFFKSKALKASISALWPYLVAPPNKMSFIYWCGMLMSYIYEGAYYCEGTFSKSADALKIAIENNGGEVLLRVKVDEIMINSGRVTGVKMANMQPVYSDIVISNADVEQTFGKLISEKHFKPNLTHKVEALEKSVSAFTVYLGVLEKPPLGYETMWYSGMDHNKNYEQLLKGDITSMAITCPTVVDPSAAPDGMHIVVLTTLAPFYLSEWDDDTKAKYAKKMIRLAEQVIPCLSEQIDFQETASPRTFEKYTLNTGGSMIGIENTPKNLLRPNLAKKSGIKGLYLVGQDGTAGGGFYGVFISGMETARKILNFPNKSEFLRLKK